MVKHQINKKNLNNLDSISIIYFKSLKINFENNDTKFMKELDNARHRKSILPQTVSRAQKRNTSRV